MIAFDESAARMAVRGVRGEEHTSAEDAYARAVWSVLVEPGDGVAGALVAEHGAAEALRRIDDSADPDVRRARARWAPRRQPGAVEAVLDAARRCGAALVVPGDAAWPTRLDDLGAHAPLALWRRGVATHAERPAVALVGARASTAYGEGVAADLAADLAAAGSRSSPVPRTASTAPAIEPRYRRAGRRSPSSRAASIVPTLAVTKRCSRRSPPRGPCGARHPAGPRRRNGASSAETV